jgi:hypothetical protein
MTRTRLVTSIAAAVAVAAFATPAAAQRRGGHGGGVSRGVAVARPHSVVVPRTVIVNRGYYRPYYYRPYYRFVPRVSLGIGLWAGYPITWSSYYYSPYVYGYPAYSPYYYGYPPPPPASYPYGNYPSTAYPPSTYPPDDSYSSGNSYPSTYPSNGYPNASGSQSYGGQPNTVDVQPGSTAANSGGISIDVDPTTASVFIDGKYMGTGADFGPNAQPLGLAPGRHRVEIRAEGYESMTFDADVAAGEVTPYKAALQHR